MIFPYVPIKSYILNGDLPAFQHYTGANFGPRLFGGFLKWGTPIAGWFIHGKSQSKMDDLRAPLF
jgi:hypothetical protein